MRRKLVVANWKMHGSLQQNANLMEAYKSALATYHDAEFAVCVPYPYLYQAQSYFQGSNIAWGSQNVAKQSNGPFTGEVSVSMLQDFGVRYVIVGHSERSLAYCESDANVAEKFIAVKQAGATPILCVGETLLEREAGVMEHVISERIDALLAVADASMLANAVISYEPIWAIGTGLSATPDQAQAMHEFIRNKIAKLNKSASDSLRILYGGSVNPSNAAQLLVMPDIDGGLIGRCSLSVQEFEKICLSANVLAVEQAKH